MGARRTRMRPIRFLPLHKCIPSPIIRKPLPAFYAYFSFLIPPPQTESKVPRLMAIVLLILHLALALVFKVLFFSYYIVKPIGTDPLEGVIGGVDATTTSATIDPTS